MLLLLLGALFHIAAAPILGALDLRAGSENISYLNCWSGLFISFGRVYTLLRISFHEFSQTIIAMLHILVVLLEY